MGWNASKDIEIMRMINSHLVVRAAEKQSVPLEDVFIGPERKKILDIVQKNKVIKSDSDAVNFKYKL